jgi:hypothetical protein
MNARVPEQSSPAPDSAPEQISVISEVVGLLTREVEAMLKYVDHGDRLSGSCHIAAGFLTRTINLFYHTKEMLAKCRSLDFPEISERLVPFVEAQLRVFQKEILPRIKLVEENTDIEYIPSGTIRRALAELSAYISALKETFGIVEEKERPIGDELEAIRRDTQKKVA